MKIVISPAKLLDFETQAPTSLHTHPQFLEDSIKLNKKLRGLSQKELATLMQLSPNLAALNYQRNQLWQPPFTLKNAKQAVYTFAGEVYKGLDANTLSQEKLPVLQDNLRILSGLYGLLKPLDLIQPYRLEMGRKLKMEKKENLYGFWGTKIADALNKEMADDEPLINLASLEYFKVIPKKGLKMPVITPIFKDLKNGNYKTIMTFAKKARGLMARYIISNEIKTPDTIKAFNENNYRFSQSLSSKTEFVFMR